MVSSMEYTLFTVTAKFVEHGDSLLVRQANAGRTTIFEVALPQCGALPFPLLDHHVRHVQVSLIVATAESPVQEPIWAVVNGQPKNAHVVSVEDTCSTIRFCTVIRAHRSSEKAQSLSGQAIDFRMNSSANV